MEVTYSLTREDYWQFNKFFLKRRRGYRLNPVIAGLVAALACALLILSDKEPLLLWAAVLAVVAAAGVGVGWVVLCRSFFLRRAVRRLPADDGSFLGEHWLRIEPEAIHGKSRIGEATIRWTGIREIAENQDYIYLFTDKHVALIVPKRAFTESEAAKGFGDTARSYWESGKRPTQTVSS